MTEPPPPRTQRIRLGAELRRLRTLAGLSGREIGAKTGISQANVSRIENGQIVPSLPQIRAWARACQAADSVPQLTGMTEAALNEVTTFRDRLRDGLPAIQQDVRQLEATTRTLRNFQPNIVPGLLQTPDYARCVLEFAQPGGDVASAVAVRLERQAIIHEPDRRFEFVLTESALRWRPASGTATMRAAQLDRIAVLAELANVAIGVIPSGTPMKAIPRCGFVLYDERDDGHQPFVIAELPHAAIYVSDPADVDIYRDQLAALRQSAMFGAEAVPVIRALAR